MYKNDIRGYEKLDKNSSKIKHYLSSCWLRYTVVQKLYSILLGEWLRYRLSMCLKVIASSWFSLLEVLEVPCFVAIRPVYLSTLSKLNRLF